MNFNSPRKRPLLTSTAIACLGIAILAVWFAKVSPTTSWKVLPRPQLEAKSREIAQHFGLNTGKWNAYLVSAVSKSLAHYTRDTPNDFAAHSLSPLTVRFTFSDKQGKAVVGVDSAGLPIYWSAPESFKKPNPAASEREAANEAFGLIAGGEASSYSAAVKSMGDDADEEDYVWKKPHSPHSDIIDRIKVVTKNAAVATAERKVYVSSDEDEDEASGDAQLFWGVIGGVFAVICTVSGVILVGIYALWLGRKSVSHKFPLRISLFAFVIMMAATVFGSSAEIRHAVSGSVVGAALGPLFKSAALLCLVAVGRGTSSVALPKWMSLEQLSGLAPLAKAAGHSLLAGALCGPTLAAIPFLIAGCGLFPHTTVAPHDLQALYSRAPLLDSVDLVSICFSLLFFGFLLPVLQRRVRIRWLFWSVTVLLGTLFFTEFFHGVIVGPLAAPLLAGLLSLGLFWFLYAYFDLLAVVTVQLISSVVLTILILAQKGFNTWPLAAAFVLMLAIAVWASVRGAAVPHGDPLATTPAVVGFRAEREKLQAEFSVARRAQEGMLPHSPPVIPGYSIAASCIPSLDVGGDLYDFLKLSDGRIGIGVADVSGKGVPAALYMTLTKGLLASVSKDNSELVAVVEEVNRHLHGVTRKKVFVTMALGFLDIEKRRLQCVRAGHNPMVWRQASRNITTLVSPSGLGLGITASRVFSTQLKMEEMALSEGDSVVFYSDGITEAMNSELEQFGENRLMKVVEMADHLDATATRDSILAAVREFLGGIHPQDDMTLVVLRVGGPSPLQNDEMRG